MRRPVAGFGARAIGEGVELLDIAQRMMGLALDPGAQAGLQRGMIAFERTGRQQRALLQGQHLRLLADQGDQHRIEFDGDRTGSGGRRHVRAYYACSLPTMRGLQFEPTNGERRSRQ